MGGVFGEGGFGYLVGGNLGMIMLLGIEVKDFLLLMILRVLGTWRF